jgi:hypothetical protein
VFKSFCNYINLSSFLSGVLTSILIHCMFAEGYYHELFLRDKRFLAKTMKRTKVKGAARQPYLPDSEPHFYDLPFLPAIGGGNVSRGPGCSGIPRSFNDTKSEEAAVVSSASSNSGASVSNGSVTSCEGYSTQETIAAVSSLQSLGGRSSSAPARMIVKFPVLPMNSITALQQYQSTGFCASDELATSAQSIFALDIPPRVSPPASARHHSIVSLTPPNEADMILGTLNAVAPYYDYGCRSINNISPLSSIW